MVGQIAPALVGKGDQSAPSVGSHRSSFQVGAVLRDSGAWLQ